MNPLKTLLSTFLVKLCSHVSRRDNLDKEIVKNTVVRRVVDKTWAIKLLPLP